MAKGRCPGCGVEGSARLVRGHMLTCPEVGKLSLAEVLDPEECFLQHQEWKRSPEGQAAKQQEVSDRIGRRKDHMDKTLARYGKRWGSGV